MRIYPLKLISKKASGYIICIIKYLSERQINLANVFIATFGLSVPVIAGLWIGRIQLGIIVSLGSLSLCHEAICDTFSEQLSNLAYAFFSSILAFALGSFFSGNGILPMILIPIIIIITSIIGRMSRPMSRASILFILFFIIATSFDLNGRRRFFVILLYSSGALWTVLLSLLFRAIYLKFNEKLNPQESDRSTALKYTYKQLFNRWKRSLSSFDAWQYTLRITLCVIAAEIIKYLWPHHRGYWILLTVAIIVRHHIDKLLPRMFKRAAGTFVGVIVSTVFIYYIPQQYIIVIIIMALAAARSILRENNYLAYSAVMTPLVIILLDFGNLSSSGVILDRLLATLFGCIISFIFGYYIWVKLFKSVKNINNEKPGTLQ